MHLLCVGQGYVGAAADLLGAAVGCVSGAILLVHLHPGLVFLIAAINAGSTSKCPGKNNSGIRPPIHHLCRRCFLLDVALLRHRRRALAQMRLRGLGPRTYFCPGPNLSARFARRRFGAEEELQDKHRMVHYLFSLLTLDRYIKYRISGSGGRWLFRCTMGRQTTGGKR